MSPRSCPVCKDRARVDPLPSGDRTHVECARCGRFQIGEALLQVFRAGLTQEEDKRLLPYLSAHTRQATEKGVTVLVAENWHEGARAHADTPVPHKALTLLKMVASRATQPHAVVKIDARLDYPLADAASVGALTFLLDYLIDNQYLRREGGQRYVVTVSGWEYLGRVLLGEVP